ncbi:MAG TPA: ABC transporter substrate-binding protein [Streptosporangiaceae bacterium]|jgi:iron complex transport system substrate-binding protein
MKTPLRAGLLAIAAAALVAGCSSSSSSSPPAASSGPPSSPPSSAAAASFPATVTTSTGTVTIKAKPARIVSLSPTATEDLYAVGAGGQVVAVDSDSDYPATAPVTKLSGLTPNVEAIAKYKPDLVIASANTNGLVSGLTKLGVPVMIEEAAANLSDAYQQIEQIGVATGHGAAGQATVTSMKNQIASDVQQAGSGHKALTYYWELSANPYYSAASSTFIGQIVGLFGLKNIADAADKASDGGYPELSEEYIVSAKPQIIFLADNEAADGGQSPSIVAKRPGWSGIPAVKDDEIVALNDDIASRWGPRLPTLVQEIAQAVEKAAS